MNDTGFFDFLFTVLVANFSRYIVISGTFFVLFYLVFKKRWAGKKIQSMFPKKNDYLREFRYSIITLLIFVGIAVIVFYSPLSIYNKVYDDIESYGWGYWWLSVIMMILLHDTYFYWTHRAMHHPKIYRHAYLVHHLSQNPSPWAAFAFHPF